MKILLGSESFPPNISGVATATQNLAENLTKNGHEAFVFTPGAVYESKYDRRFPDYKVLRLKSIINPFRAGYRVTFASKKKIREEVIKIAPDLIHIQDPAYIGTALRDIGRELDIPVIVTNHFSLEYALSYVKFMRPVMPMLRQGLISYLVNFYNKCDQVVTPTETFRKELESWGVKTPVQAVSNGIEIEQFLKKVSEKELKQTKDKFHLPNNPIVLYLGRVDKDKDIACLANAIPLVLKKLNAHFVIAGTGGALPEVQKIVNDAGISNAVTFLGFIEHNSPDFVNLYKNSALFAIPSPIETQSIVTLEALSTGLPVVGANSGALPELIHNNKNGFLFKTGDHKQLSASIIDILSDKKKAKRMGRTSIGIALHHEMDKAFNVMLDLYEEVIDRKKTKND
ncbi:MAG: glycosyltransferase [Patescibacteria group bacterium]